MNRKPRLSDKGLRELARAQSPSEFLRAILKDREDQGSPLSYSALSKKAGFSSRNFARDVALGTKGLSAESTQRFSQALKLNAPLSRHFALLAERERRKSNPQEFSRLSERIQSSANRLLGNDAASGAVGNKLYSIDSAVKVYAALGPSSTGATLQEIKKRTGLSEEKIKVALNKLIEGMFAKAHNETYFATKRHLSFERMGGEQAFQELFLNSSRAIHRKATEDIADRKNLFFQSYFSVPEHKMEELSSALNELLLGFIDENENASGDKVATLLCSLVI